MDPAIEPLLNAAARPYFKAGLHPWLFARGKLHFDPAFVALLRRGDLPDRGTLLDVGCGQGPLLALLVAARSQYRAGRWPAGWPAPPLNLALRGLDVREDRVRAANAALGGSARVERHDARRADFGACSAIAMLDVLFYMREDDQVFVLEKAARALGPGGLLLLREADAGAGARFRVTKWAERIAEAARGRLRDGLQYRSARQWIALLEETGFAVTAEPMSAGTPFANVLFVARKKPKGAADERR